MTFAENYAGRPWAFAGGVGQLDFPFPAGGQMAHEKRGFGTTMCLVPPYGICLMSSKESLKA